MGVGTRPIILGRGLRKLERTYAAEACESWTTIADLCCGDVVAGTRYRADGMLLVHCALLSSHVV